MKQQILTVLNESKDNLFKSRRQNKSDISLFIKEFRYLFWFQQKGKHFYLIKTVRPFFPHIYYEPLMQIVLIRTQFELEYNSNISFKNTEN